MTGDGLAIGGAWRYRWLAFALLVALTVPRLVQRGMFLDGMVYASVSRNLSAGIGRFWTPRYTDTTYATFYEHPPLGFALESVAFRVLGDHPATERVYSLVVFGLTALLIAAIWRQVLPHEYDWLPIYFWILPSIVTWAVINNMLENTQVVFTTAAVAALLRASGRRAGSCAAWSAAAGLAVVAAVFVKGPVGLFPLAVPLFLLLVPAGDRPRDVAMMCAALFGTVAVAAALVALLPASRHAVNEYVHAQLLPSLAGQREVDTTRLGVFRHLGAGILLRMAVVLAVIALAGRRRATGGAPPRAAWFFFGVGLAASLPLAVSPKMMGQYFVPCVPFFALASAVMAVPFLRLRAGGAGASWLYHVPASLAAVLLILAVLVPVIHGTLEPRDRRILADVDAVAPALSAGVTVGTCRESELDWGLRAYLERFLRVSFVATGAPVGGRFLKYQDACAPPPACRPIAGETDMVLYQCGPGRANAGA